MSRFLSRLMQIIWESHRVIFNYRMMYSPKSIRYFVQLIRHRVICFEYKEAGKLMASIKVYLSGDIIITYLQSATDRDTSSFVREVDFHIRFISGLIYTVIVLLGYLVLGWKLYSHFKPV